MTSVEIGYSICHEILASSLVDHRNFVWALITKITMYINKLTVLGRNTLLKYIKIPCIKSFPGVHYSDPE